MKHKAISVIIIKIVLAAVGIQCWSIYPTNSLYDNANSACHSSSFQLNGTKCRVDRIQRRCASMFNILLSPNITSIAENINNEQCCDAWRFYECILATLCTECGADELMRVKQQQLEPMRHRLEQDQCRDHHYDSFTCHSKSPFVVGGAIFIAASLLLAATIFAYYRCWRRKRASPPAYKVFY